MKTRVKILDLVDRKRSCSIWTQNRLWLQTSTSNWLDLKICKFLTYKLYFLENLLNQLKFFLKLTQKGLRAIFLDFSIIHVSQTCVQKNGKFQAIAELDFLLSGTSIQVKSWLSTIMWAALALKTFLAAVVLRTVAKLLARAKTTKNWKKYELFSILTAFFILSINHLYLFCFFI